MSKKYDMLVFIGRFQPFHNGHKRVIDRALTLAERVLILVGSSNVSRSMRNPWTFQERSNMIHDVYMDEGLAARGVRLVIRPLNDMMYNDERWIEQVQSIANKEILGNVEGNNEHVYIRGLNDLKIGLVGCQKDHTSYYLKLFPTWTDESVQYLDPINATDIRDVFFAKNGEGNIREYLPNAVYNYLIDFLWEPEYEELIIETEFTKKYKQSVQKYPRIEHTVDSVVVQSGHVLLIRRRAAPGKGKWALPGGFINPDEKLLDAAIRELREETKLKVPDPVLRGNIVKDKTYDDPMRSDRARIITQAFLIKLPNQIELPKVRGADDADKAAWVPLAELDPKVLFEDHYFIIQDMIGEL